MSARRTFFCSGFAILSRFLFSSRAQASVGFQPVDSAELQMTSEPLAPGAPAINFFREVDRDDLGRGSHGGVTVMDNEALTGRYEDNYFRVKILTEEGRGFANVEVPFAKMFEVTARSAASFRGTSR